MVHILPPFSGSLAVITDRLKAALKDIELASDAKLPILISGGSGYGKTTLVETFASLKNVHGIPKSS